MWRWLVLQIVYKKIADLKKYEKNNKKHPERQLVKIVASIKEYGFKNPVLIDKNNVIIAGHGRTLAAERLGMEEVPCIDCSDLNAKQVKALRLMDNKSAELAEWDFDNIKAELEELKLQEFDIDLTGFDSIELNQMTDDNSNDIEEVENVNMYYNFIIKCEGISELNKLKDILKVSAEKVKFKDITL